MINPRLTFSEVECGATIRITGYEDVSDKPSRPGPSSCIVKCDLKKDHAEEMHQVTGRGYVIRWPNTRTGKGQAK